jgi:hypothetical protein
MAAGVISDLIRDDERRSLLAFEEPCQRMALGHEALSLVQCRLR